MILKTANRLQFILKNHPNTYKLDPMLWKTHDPLDVPGIPGEISNFGSHQAENAMSMGMMDVSV